MSESTDAERLIREARALEDRVAHRHDAKNIAMARTAGEYLFELMPMFRSVCDAFETTLALKNAGERSNRTDLEAALAREQAAIKKRDEAREALPIYWRKLAADNDDLKQSLETMTGYYDTERAANAKLTEENRVLRADLAAATLRLALATKPAGANDDH